MCGGQLEKRRNETEDDFQRRLIRTQQQEQRLAKAGITPEARQTAIQASAKARQLKALRDQLGQEATNLAYERDPDIIRKREAIAKKERENAIFSPIVRGLTGIADVGTQLVGMPGVSQVVGTTPLGQALKGVSSLYQNFVSDQLNQGFAREDAVRQARADKIAGLADANRIQQQQLGDALQQVGVQNVDQVDFRDLDRQIADQERLARGGAKAMPRFGVSRFF
jgi:hypothetical protein